MEWKQIVQQVAKKMVASAIDGEPREWPPSCGIFAYQPMRPERKADNSDCAEVTNNEKEN